MAQETIAGTLTIQVTKEKKTIYKATFEGKKGQTSMAIQPTAQYFSQADATDGCAITITRENGQIQKVTIDGKTECTPSAPQPKKSFAQKPGGKQTVANSSSQPQFGTTKTFIPPATAPYNFIAQPCVLPAPDLTEERYSGSITVTLSTLTPLLVSGAENKQDAMGRSIREFFTVGERCVIPGSSLKGMLRSTIEMLTSSAIQPINDRHVFWRSFDSEDYKEIFQVGIQSTPQKAGYLVRKNTEFFITPVPYTLVPLKCPKNPGKTRVETGPMPKKEHDYDFDPYEKHAKDKAYPVDDELIDNFILQLTPAQLEFIKQRTNGEVDNENALRRSMKRPLPVFFLEEKGKILFMGLARYFRFQAKNTPTVLRDKTTPPLPENTLDFCMQLFGYANKNTSRRGRVSVSRAIFPKQVQKKELPPVVLGQPCHTCFAHYLVQPATICSMKKQKNRWDINSMHTYNTQSKIRGRKFYWHRNPETPPTNNKPKCESVLHPIESNEKAEFTISLDRLSLIELGAIIEAVSLPKGHAHHMGMGKSLGLGSVRLDIREMNITTTKTRYGDLESRCQALFLGSKPKKTQNAEQDAEIAQRAREAFRAWLVSALTKAGYPAKSYEEIPHIADFLRITDFAKRPDNTKTRFMALTEFQKRRVLPEIRRI
ncbi:MAG: TIGR03986 family CRISPR-associated RAMP protein [Desulfovibrionaceae bacterium]|nr:TIGR03986 family CRISPR-associated RAMP protein [Desulfovibrionaceae bacterium]